ncbi:DUF6682 family protein [Aminobacter sp. MDW-2]|uniref:phage adaptor protein n=1 Tax=Aminobacter sp. MDW-2 TaxID=2666139 RepID=UPI0012B05991|nr:DUF6682 family protein [Aminobacter sp. MDW-2]MRX32810.1 hypothetical protein [Aminobacter sp. MDW-2]QNH34531.1 hypothetical protein H5P29_00825 [Aminobacter sp. MDW-2]
MPTGKDIMVRAGVLLMDEEHVRWPLAELCEWINDGVKAIVLAKPSASSLSQPLQMVAGTLQSVPTSGTPTPLALLNITRNLAGMSAPRVGGRVVRPVARSLLDAQDPYWHDKTRTRFARVVKHFIFDELNPLEFYVYPGNDGAGVVEAVLSVLPAPLAATGDAAQLSSYAGDVGLPEPYSVPLLDYVLFRSQMKDDEAGNPGRSVAHYQQFATAVGLKIQVEGAHSPNARK